MTLTAVEKSEKERLRLYEKNVRIRNGTVQALIERHGTRCNHCGVSYPFPVLDFHHIDHKQKEFSVSQKIGKASKERVLAEAEKCILLCANCHRLEHLRLREEAKNARTAVQDKLRGKHLPAQVRSRPRR